MKFTRIDPPGARCLYAALFEMLKEAEGRRFLEIGCGAGEASAKLLKRGYNGVGVDFSPRAIEAASQNLSLYIQCDRYRLVESDIFDNPFTGDEFDFAISLFVMEHIRDDMGYMRLLKSKIRKGGHVIVSVPSRQGKWSFEDDTVGHIRRYDRKDLIECFEKAGLKTCWIWSIGVPMQNMLFGASNMVIRLSGEGGKLHDSQKDNTKASGVRQVPFKTVFPSFFNLFFNDLALLPAFVIQRFFYNTGYGLTMLAMAEKDS